MGAERRKHRRVPVRIDGQWKGTSAGGLCKLANLSMGGCFLRAPAKPAPGESAVLTMYFDRHGPMTLEGRVVHVLPPSGFALQFHKMTPSLLFQLGIHMEAL